MSGPTQVAASTAAGTDARRLAVAAGAIVFLAVLVRTAWLDDDAFITFRTVDNFLNGYGLRWNVGNRVQAYTHPLWMGVVTAVVALTRELYYSVLALSVAISTGAVILLASRVARNIPSIVLAFSALGLSKAYVDYSTSGLENPLTHLLLVLFVIAAAAPEPSPAVVRRVTLLASLLMVNRLDAGLLVLPTVGLLAWRAGVARAWRGVAVGLLPLVAWETFALIYYGFPFPNTAYSKLQHGIPAAELVHQGKLYLLDSLAHDPLTLGVIIAALARSVIVRDDGAMSAGIALYLVYIVSIGGDFMSGRFLTAPFLLAVLSLIRHPMPAFGGPAIAAVALVWMLGLAAPRPTILSDATYGAGMDPADAIAATGITDERLFYYPASGLLNATRDTRMPDHKWIDMGRELRSSGTDFFATDAAGFIGYAAGPGVHLIDKYGLPDPLLARLPAESPWRIGHFQRAVPEGYEETIRSGENRIRDPGLAAYYDKLRLITEEPIWSWERLVTIVRMNLGHYDRFLSFYVDHRPRAKSEAIDE